MRRFRKRLLALAGCVVLSAALIPAATAASTENCPGSCSHEAAIGTTHYDTLADALTAATDGCTVTVLADVSTAAIALDKSITLDLGGKTVTGQNTEDESLLTVTKDITVKNGTLATEAGAVLMATDCAVVIEETTTLTAGTDVVALILQSLEHQTAATISGTLTNKGGYPTVGAVASSQEGCLIKVNKSAVITSEEYDAINMHGSGSLEITGGTITAKENAVYLDIYDDQTMTASVTGGKFYAENGKTIDVNQGENATAPADFVIGGTYNKVPTDYMPSYCRTVDNGDGTYTVIAEYAVSVSPGGGSGTMATAKVDRGTTITLPKCTLTAPAGKHFKAWSVSGQEFAPGASFAVNSDVTLTAVWADHSGGAASCTQKAVCSTCGVAYGDYGTHYLTASNGYAATCEAAGMNAHSQCSSCGQYFVSGIAIRASSLTIPALDHDMVAVEGKDATCTEDGLLAHEKCSQCGLLQAKGEAITEEELVLPASGHALENVAAVESTCTESGNMAHQICSNCGILLLGGKETTKDALSVAVTSHVLSDWETDAATHWKTCVSCGEIFRQHSHADTNADNACDECGYAMTSAEDAQVQQEEGGFSWLFLIPVAVAVVIAVGIALPLAIKKRK